MEAGRRSGRSEGEAFGRRVAAALNIEPGTGALRRLALAVLVPVLVILGGALSVGVGIGVAKLFSGTAGGDPSQSSPKAVSAAPAVAPIAAEGTEGKGRKTKRPEKKSATPVSAVSEPSFAPAPTTHKRSPATIQPASEPVRSSPAPSEPVGSAPPPSSGSGGGSNHPAPQVQHGIGGGEAWHGIAPGGG